MPYFNKQRSKWMAQVVFNGMKHRSQHDSKNLAKQWEVDTRRALEGGVQSQPIRIPSLLELANSYLDYSKTRHGVGVYNEKSHAFRLLFKSGIDPGMEVSKLAKGDVLAHLSRQAVERSGHAANNDRKNLIAAWNWALKYLPGFPSSSNPFIVDKFAAVHAVRYVPSERDFWAVHSCAEGMDKLMLLCYLHLAARRSEIFGLRREHVDLERRMVALQTRKRKGGSLHVDWIPMTDRLHKEMSAHLAVVSGPWVFPNPMTGLPYVERTRWLSSLCAKAGVKPFGLHGIRHLAASILVNAKVSLLDVQTILRHVNLLTTQRYVHRLESVREAIKAFE